MAYYYGPKGSTYTLYEDMLKEPHLLIAGATGSGKSVLINGLIATLLYRLPWDTDNGAEFILIDPKRVELVIYKNTPHCIRYASEPDTMLAALRYAMTVTERRYTKMQERRQRKYTGSDIYVIVDEFADLITTQPHEIVPLVQRLAQLGRAAKVHLIIATQTPIAAILPTRIKCNFDARVALRTRSAQDSRNILGITGCEKLPRYGQCYYMNPEGIKRWNVPYIDDAELDRLAKYCEDEIKRCRKEEQNSKKRTLREFFGF